MNICKFINETNKGTILYVESILMEATKWQDIHGGLMSVDLFKKKSDYQLFIMFLDKFRKSKTFKKHGFTKESVNRYLKRAEGYVDCLVRVRR